MREFYCAEIKHSTPEGKMKLTSNHLIHVLQLLAERLRLQVQQLRARIGPLGQAYTEEAKEVPAAGRVRQCVEVPLVLVWVDGQQCVGELGDVYQGEIDITHCEKRISDETHDGAVLERLVFCREEVLGAWTGLREEHKVGFVVGVWARGDEDEHGDDGLGKMADPKGRLPACFKGICCTLPCGLYVYVVGCVIPVHLPLPVDIVWAIDSECERLKK
jgi:hypothetical protein